MCNTGKMASILSFSLDLIGLNSFLYDESLSGWNDTAPLTE